MIGGTIHRMRFLPLRAIIEGIRLCVGEKEIRRFAVRPWIIGLLAYAVSLIGALYAHAGLVFRLAGVADGFWGSILYALVWVLAAALLIITATIITFVLVMVLGGIYQTSIAEHVLARMGAKEAPAGTTYASAGKEFVRSVAVESLKLLWILPLMFLVFILGFIPPLLPLAIIAAAWLLAYQSVDFALDVLKFPVWRRVRYAAGHAAPLAIFGLGLMALALLPLAIIFLPPVGAAGGAWLVFSLGGPNGVSSSASKTPDAPV